MEYTIQKISRMAGISTRTLRYYDEIDLLKPARINSSGYRIYGSGEIDRLQQILFYRELGMGLEEIKDILDDPAFDALLSLEEHLDKLLLKKEQIEALITNVKKTILSRKGGTFMTDQEKFEGFKKQLIDENEKKYGREVREKYGEEAVLRSNQVFNNMSKQDYDEFVALGEQTKQVLAKAVKTGDPAGPLAQKAAELHKKWLSAAWGYYSPEAHAGIVQMYVDDERFTAYYDEKQPGTAAFLREAVHIYTGKKK